MPYPNFNAEADAQALRTAMKGHGADEAAIKDILCTRSCDQRVEIVREYKKLFRRDLVTNIKSEIRGRFEELMVTLLYPMEEFLARELRAAMKGTHTDEDCLVEILCTRSNKDVSGIKESYAKAFGKDLESDVKSVTSPEFTKLLVLMCNATRQEGGTPDPSRAKNDALQLQQAGVTTWSTDGSLFNQMLASQSFEHLRLVFLEYNNLTGRSVVQAIESEMTGNVRTAYLAIATCLANIPYYFAGKLDSAIKAEGVESSDKTLVRIIVSRCEVDLAEIKEVYARNFNMTLQDAIRRDKSGDYRDSLLILVQGKLARPRSRSDDSMPATLRPYAAFNAQADANTLWNAMKGKGADKTAIMEVLCARSGDQRQEIIREYKQMFNRDLEPHIKSELRGRFEELVMTLLCPMEDFLARELRAAIKGVGADEDVLVEILCTRSNKDIRGIKESYAKAFGRDVESDLGSEASAEFRKLIISMCTANRQEAVLDFNKARNDANLIEQAAVKTWSNDGSLFNQILTNQSYEQLRLTFQEYNNLAGRSVQQAIESEMTGNLRAAYIAIIKCVVNIPYFFAEKLERAIKAQGVTTSDKTLVRIIVSRCEVDLVHIKAEYAKNFKMELQAAIRRDKSGDYREALLLLVQGN